MAQRRPVLGTDPLLRVLARVQADLADDLRLGQLAETAGLSRAHFQRAFTVAVGSSPAAYVARVRVERAAFLLRLQRGSVLAVALSVGFANPDTFTRAFRRRFGVTPQAYRRVGVPGQTGDPPRRGEAPSRDHALSPTRVIRTRELCVAFERHVGPYEDVDPRAWTRLTSWAKARGVAFGACLGIGHDAPGVTAAKDLRFDAGLLVGETARPGAGVGVQRLPAATVASTTHVGAYATLPAAYPEIFARCAAIRGHRLVGLPVVEIYHDASIDLARRVSVTDVLVPVERSS